MALAFANGLAMSIIQCEARREDMTFAVGATDGTLFLPTLFILIYAVQRGHGETTPFAHAFLGQRDLLIGDLQQARMHPPFGAAVFLQRLGAHNPMGEQQFSPGTRDSGAHEMPSTCAAFRNAATSQRTSSWLWRFTDVYDMLWKMVIRPPRDLPGSQKVLIALTQIAGML